MELIQEQMGMGKTLTLDMDAAIESVTLALQMEGFGVLTEIDVKQTLHNKLGVAFRRYRILGACNPPLAYEALQNELEIGLLLPCNVIVYETDDGQTAVAIANPLTMVSLATAPGLRQMAEVAHEKLTRVLSYLPSAN